MDVLTIIMFVMVIALYVLSLVVKRTELTWGVVFLSVCGIGQALSDTTLVNNELIILVVPMFFCFLESCVKVYFHKE